MLIAIIVLDGVQEAPHFVHVLLQVGTGARIAAALVIVNVIQYVKFGAQHLLLFRRRPFVLLKVVGNCFHSLNGCKCSGHVKGELISIARHNGSSSTLSCSIPFGTGSLPWCIKYTIYVVQYM